MLVIHTNQEESKSINIVRRLDTILPNDVHILLIDNPNMLQSEFGIVPDNYIATVRFLKKENSSPNQSYNHFSFDTTTKAWIKVLLFNVDKYST